MTCMLLIVNFLNAEQVNNALTTAAKHKAIICCSVKIYQQGMRDPHDHKDFIDSISKEASNNI